MGIKLIFTRKEPRPFEPCAFVRKDEEFNGTSLDLHLVTLLN